MTGEQIKYLNFIQHDIEELLEETNEKYPVFDNALTNMMPLPILSLPAEERYAYSVWNTCISILAYIDTIKEEASLDTGRAP